MNNPKITAEFIDGEFQVKLENWTGISVMHIERFAYNLHKASHQENVRKLHQMHVAEKAAGEVPAKPGSDSDFIKDLENAIQQTSPSLAR